VKLMAPFSACSLTSWCPQPTGKPRKLVENGKPCSIRTGFWASLSTQQSTTSLINNLRTLGDRFGQRYRPYTAHEAKTLVKSIVDEVTITWNSELHHTGQQRFRLNPEAKDAYLPFLVTHWTVERHREALLWSWVVARIGGDDDEWGPAQSAQAWSELGGASGQDLLNVRRKPRSTLHQDQVISVLDSTGDTSIGKSHYAFSSRDGYPYVRIGSFFPDSCCSNVHLT
jgi:hypothetical protein